MKTANKKQEMKWIWQTLQSQELTEKMGGIEPPRRRGELVRVLEEEEEELKLVRFCAGAGLDLLGCESGIGCGGDAGLFSSY